MGSVWNSICGSSQQLSIAGPLGLDCYSVYMLFNAVQVCSGSEEQRHSEEQAAKQKQRTVPLGMPHRSALGIL